jgi:NAD(P)-dependent dehydrogenase (short-subunit alcohol dehydrogenase family)
MTTRSNNYGTALITGTSSGIGLELALEFGACAARIPVGACAPEIQEPNV